MKRIFKRYRPRHADSPGKRVYRAMREQEKRVQQIIITEKQEDWVLS